MFKRKYPSQQFDESDTPKTRRITSDQFYKLSIPFPISIDVRCKMCKQMDMSNDERYKIKNGNLIESKIYCSDCVADKICIANALFRITKRCRED